MNTIDITPIVNAALALIGALLAVPLTAAIKVLYKRYIWQNASMRPMTEPVLPPEHPGEQPPDTPEDSAHA